MKTVCIVCGTYGHRDEAGHLILLRAGDTVSLPDDQAQRLVDRRVGTIITGNPTPTPEPPKAKAGKPSVKKGKQPDPDAPPVDTLEDPVV